MASNSSTSNSELTPLERVRPQRIPLAAIAFLIGVVAVETVLSHYQQWFADMAAWQWKSKQDSLNAGNLDGDIAIFGTSVLFHGLDPTPANAALGPARTVVNLALNGMELQHETQLLRERLASSHPPKVVVLEFRRIFVEPESWIRGPYFRSWSSFEDFAESRFFYWEPSLILPFATNRTLASFRYREALDNWLSEIPQVRGLPAATYDRNTATATSIRTHFGMAPATFDGNHQPDYRGPARPRKWEVNEAGQLWLEEFLSAANRRGTLLVLLVPPAPPYFFEEPGPSGFRARLNAAVDSIHARFPSLEAVVFEPGGFNLTDFADDVHLNASGRSKLSGQFAEWIRENNVRLTASNAR